MEGQARDAQVSSRPSAAPLGVPPPPPTPPGPQERSLDPAVSVPVYTSHAAAVSGGSGAGEMFLGAGERAALWLGAPPEDKMPKDVKEGGPGGWRPLLWVWWPRMWGVAASSVRRGKQRRAQKRWGRPRC
jgi:hypothetical protein